MTKTLNNANLIKEYTHHECKIDNIFLPVVFFFFFKYITVKITLINITVRKTDFFFLHFLSLS